MELDQVGVMVGSASDENLLAAMTLRDCTMYIKCTTADPKGWVAKIGDLDLKMGTKLAYWRTIEKSLIDEGWYEGTENGDKRQLLDCHLSSKRYRLP
jgi:inositol-pentakisphosphate 2-kinase